jgi:hypothetical protein
MWDHGQTYVVMPLSRNWMAIRLATLDPMEAAPRLPDQCQNVSAVVHRLPGGV